MREDYQVEDLVMLCLTLPSGKILKKPSYISAIEPYYDRGEIAFYHYTVGNMFHFGKDRILPYKGFEPIPLTNEIMRNNGFYEFGEEKFWIKPCVCWIKGMVYVELEEYCEPLCKCEFVHQLQHTLKLLEIEKEITI